MNLQSLSGNFRLSSSTSPSGSPHSSAHLPPPKKNKNADVFHLKILYVFLFVLSVAGHWYTIASIATSENPDVTGARVFVPSTYTWKKSLDWGLLYIFQWDWIVLGASCLVASWIALSDVQRLNKGEASVENVLEGFIVVLTIAIGGGPSAALAAVWYWREIKMAEVEAAMGAKKGQ